MRTTKLLLTLLGLVLSSLSPLSAQWAKSVGGTSSVLGPSIAVDASGNVYVTGVFQGTADFDPGAGTTNLTSAGGADMFLA